MPRSRHTFPCSGSLFYFSLVVAIILVAAVMIIRAAGASAGFPPASYLEQTYHFQPGMPFPQAVVWNGHVFVAYYDRGDAQGNGQYRITITLKETNR